MKLLLPILQLLFFSSASGGFGDIFTILTGAIQNIVNSMISSNMNNPLSNDVCMMTAPGNGEGKLDSETSSHGHGAINDDGSTSLADNIDASGLTPQNYTMKKLQAGVNAGNAIITAISSDTFSENFGRIGIIAKKMAPFLGAVGPLIGFISLFLPVGPSKELQYMIRAFAQINNRFDQVFSRIDELESTVIEKAIKSQYSSYQSEISSLSTLLNSYLNSTANGSSESASSNSRKKLFLSAYESSDKTATLKLWQGMMLDRSLSDNIPYSIAKYTFNNRLRTQNLIKRILSTILKGVNVMTFYYKLSGDNDSYVDQSRIWEGRIQRLTDRMQEVDSNVRDKYIEQAEKDTEGVLTERDGASNEVAASAIYSFLTAKFEWRNWLVVVYNSMSASNYKEQQYQHCGGFKRFEFKGRNTIVASNNKNESMYIDKITQIFADIDIGGRHRPFHFNAKGTWLQIPECMRSNCTYPGLGVLPRFQTFLAFKAPENHLVLRDKTSSEGRTRYKLFAFR
nr:N-U8 [Pinctada fucata]